MDIDIFPIIVALIAYGTYSGQYKWNPLSRGVQCAVTGGSLAMFTMRYGEAVINDSVKPFIAGDYLLIGALILGFGYFAYLIPRIKVVYRSILALNLATTVGISAPLTFSLVWSWISGFAWKATQDVGRFFAMIGLAFALMNFLYSKMLDRTWIRPVRTVGRFVIFVNAATIMTMCFVSNSNMLMYNSIAVWNGPAWWVPLVILGFILIDVFGGFNSIKKRFITVKA